MPYWHWCWSSPVNQPRNNRYKCILSLNLSIVIIQNELARFLLIDGLKAAKNCQQDSRCLGIACRQFATSIWEMPSMTRQMRSNPFHPLRDDVDQLMQGLFGRWPRTWAWDLEDGKAFPALNVWEEGDRLFVEAELPGLSTTDLDISVLGDELTLKGSRGDAAAGEGVKYHRRERGVGAFTRVVKLPYEVVANDVRANLRDGVLLVTLAKAEAAKPRRIAVGSGE
jgi:HSP20 family protein